MVVHSPIHPDTTATGRRRRRQGSLENDDPRCRSLSCRVAFFWIPLRSIQASDVARKQRSEIWEPVASHPRFPLSDPQHGEHANEDPLGAPDLRPVVRPACVLAQDRLVSVPTTAPQREPLPRPDRPGDQVRRKDGAHPTRGSSRTTSSSSSRPRRAASTCCSSATRSPTAGRARQGGLEEALREAQRRQLRHRRRPHAARALAHRERRARRHQAEGRRPDDRHEQHRCRRPPSRSPQGVTKIVKTIREKTRREGPAARRVPARREPREGRQAAREDHAQINEIIAKLDDGKNVRYLDIEDKFLQPDGTIARRSCPTSCT